MEQLVAADQQVDHPGARQPGLRHVIAPAVINGLLDFGQLSADVAHHRLGALAGSGAGRLLHGFHSVGYDSLSCSRSVGAPEGTG